VSKWGSEQDSIDRHRDRVRKPEGEIRVTSDNKGIRLVFITTDGRSINSTIHAKAMSTENLAQLLRDMAFELTKPKPPSSGVSARLAWETG